MSAPRHRPLSHLQSLAHNLVARLRSVLGLALVACSSAAACVDAGGISALRPRETKVTLTSPSLVAEVAPSEDWRRAAAGDDWASLARAIDRLPAGARSAPGVRYARAVAATRLGDGARALPLLAGLAEQLPALRAEIEELTASCQLELGPFEAAAEYYAAQDAPWAWLKSALGWQRAQRLPEAIQQVERVLAVRKLDRSTLVQAHRLRAELAERAGDVAVARREYYWLAVKEASPGADATYERLARSKLSKAERLMRVQELAQRGQVEAVERELAQLRRASGRAPARSELLRWQALARYRSRDYAKAAALFDQAARLPGRYHVSDRFLAAEAWSRARRAGPARAIYREIARRYPRRSGTAEKADFLHARLYYGRGQWDAAERAYGQYLSRHRRGPARHAVAARYERALSRLAAGRAEQARRDFAELRRSRTNHAAPSLLRHLEAVAALSSDSATLQSQGVAELEAIVQDEPLSFAAMSSAARLARLGRHTRLAAAHAPRSAPLAADPLELPELPEKPRLLAQLGLLSAAEAALHAQEPELLRLYAPNGGQTLCRQYGELKRGFRGYRLARSVLRAGALGSLPTSSSLWAWQCLYPQPFASVVADLESHYQLPPGLLHAVMRQESQFRPDARSHAGALGLMQLMPATARRVAEELGLPLAPGQLLQPAHNLRLGAHYLDKLLATFDERAVLALASYNAGPHAVERWLEGAGGLDADLWVARIPYRETRNYVQHVMANWARYGYLASGAAPASALGLQLPRKLKLPPGLY